MIVNKKFSIEQFLVKVKETFGIDRFESGDCHHLAISIYNLDNGKGAISIGIREQYDNKDLTGDPVLKFFSHAVYKDENGEAWDIGGKDAIERWEMLFQDYELKHGLWNKFTWVDLTPETIPSFIAEFRSSVDYAFCNELCVLYPDPAFYKNWLKNLPNNIYR